MSASFRSRFLVLLWSGVQVATQRAVWYKDATTEIAVDGADTGTGGVSSSTSVADLCALINWSISGSYRGGHPRTYLPGLPVGDLATATHLSTTPRSSFTTAAGNFLSDVNALTPSGWSAVQLGTIRFFRNNAALSPPVFEPFLAGSCNPILGSQRRRVGR